MSWNCNGKLNLAINFMDQYISTHEVIHTSGSKHNLYTNFKIPINFKCISKPGGRKEDVDRGEKYSLHKNLVI